MRYLILAFCLAVAAHAASPTVNILPSPLAVIPVNSTEVAVTQVTLSGTNAPFSLALVAGVADFSGVVVSQAGAVINEIQKTRFIALLDSYKQEAHIAPVVPSSGSTNAIWRLSAQALSLYQLLERLELQNISLALVAPPTTNGVPVGTNGPPIIVLPPDGGPIDTNQ